MYTVCAKMYAVCAKMGFSMLYVRKWDCVYGLYVQKWAVYMGRMCCSSGMKSALKISSEIGLQNG